MQIGFYVLLFIIGACFGSFLCCQARRIHLKHQNDDLSHTSGKKSNKSLPARSICLHCHYQLKWYDNIPVVSWLLLRGKCRKCHRKIGIAEFLAELGVALAFLALGITIDLETADVLTWIIFIMTLIFTLSASFLAIYDGLYGELPSKALLLSIICATVLLLLKEASFLTTSSFKPEFVYNPILSVAVLSGIYLVLHKLSNGKWVGDGDWLLGLALALALYDPWLSLITLFISNLLACLVMYPIVRKKKHAHIYFGPFLVIAFVITLTFADFFYYAIGG